MCFALCFGSQTSRFLGFVILCSFPNHVHFDIFNLCLYRMLVIKNKKSTTSYFNPADAKLTASAQHGSEIMVSSV